LPELPEVETTVRGVQPFVTGVRITGVVVRQRQLRWLVPRGLTRTLSGHKVASVSRRAKYILLNFSHGTLMIHLGMSGRLRVVPEGTPAQKHDHVDLVLGSKKVLRFHDPRRFGSVLWIKGGIQNSALLRRLGPEPFDEQLTEAMLHRLSRGRRTSIKQFIMDGRYSWVWATFTPVNHYFVPASARVVPPGVSVCRNSNDCWTQSGKCYQRQSMPGALHCVTMPR